MAGAHEVHTVTGGRALLGSTRVPGDKSISHRALLLAALAEGTSTISGLSTGEDVVCTRRAIEILGAEVIGVGTEVTVQGGRSRLSAPERPIDLGNSGTGMRLLAGVVATVPGVTHLTGDASLCTRPMDRVAVPLALMGAQVEGAGDRCLPPIAVSGGALVGIDYTPPMASAQVKGAILLAGLDADGETVVREAVATRTHTEDMLAEAGANIEVEVWGSGRIIRLRRSALAPVTHSVPGDPSQAAFWVVAGVVVPASRITVEDVHLGPERIGFLEVLRRMGADLVVDATQGGHSGSITVGYSTLVGTTVEAAEIPSLDEVPILAVAAMAAAGTTRFRDVGELRVKESDRLEGTARLVRAFGGRADIEGEDLLVTGGAGLTQGAIDAQGDHRMAMAAAIAAAACPAATGATDTYGASGATVITGWESVATSYPDFAYTLDQLAGGPR